MMMTRRPFINKIGWLFPEYRVIAYSKHNTRFLYKTVSSKKEAVALCQQLRNKMAETGYIKPVCLRPDREKDILYLAGRVSHCLSDVSLYHEQAEFDIRLPYAKDEYEIAQLIHEFVDLV